MPDAASPLAPLVRAAAEGLLPKWARASAKRRAHMERVAGLMRGWARELGLADAEVRRWAAAGWLHDALRDAEPDELRPQVPKGFRALRGKVLHGPAAAERLAGEADEELREAVRWHTLGSPRFRTLGRALYLADFLEPGRPFAPETEAWRRRMPHELDAVLREVVDSRVRHVERGGGAVHPETRAFHASLAQ
ncbi:MAG TPA: HD domain-containing protein [Longimicrobiaceae bacterium]|nr:HD domain-containing protein [Longimicrobiaceae bacterium]